MHARTQREKALTLRRNGYSYLYISNRTGLSKSTLSGWLSEVPFTPNKETVKAFGRARAAAAGQKAWKRQQHLLQVRSEARKDIGKISKRDLFMFGLGLYLGEGAKTHSITCVVNADPRVIVTAIAWFRMCGVSMKQFSPRLFSYPDNDIQRSLRFWSKTTSIPRSQFLKTQIDRREGKKAKKQGKLPHGTLHLRFRSDGKKELGVAFFRKIQAWNDDVLQQIQADVV